MKDLADSIRRLGDELAEVSRSVFGDSLGVEPDDEVLRVLAAAAQIERLAQAMMTAAIAEVLVRDDLAPHADRVTTRYGCRNIGELVQRATRLSQRGSADLVTAAWSVRCPVAPSSGERLPSEFPAMRAALADGAVGSAAVVVVAQALRNRGISQTDLRAADEELAAAARGIRSESTTDADAAASPPPVSVDELRAFAQVWASFLDPDGAEPTEARAMRKRGFTIGKERPDGLVPLRGDVLPEVAAQLQREFDAILNPRVDGPPVPGPRFVASELDGLAEIEDSTAPGPPDADAADPRTPAQKRHDAFATVVIAAASAASMPTLGGAPPTLVVSVLEEDFVSGKGVAFVADHAPVSLAAARHVACVGAVERVVMSKDGRIVSIETLDRTFTHHQRRAIAVRDGTCFIPSCFVPAEWCEVHHVIDHARGGPTHTGNGVLACWYHHRTLDVSAWEVRMIDGVPHVRGPAWWDPDRIFRPITNSPTRRRRALQQRT